jgi:hypothetical protein
MNRIWSNAMSQKVLLVSGVFVELLSTQIFATGADIPDALSVEWQGKKPCELLGEDPQIRIMHCAFSARGQAFTSHSPSHFQLCAERRQGASAGRERSPSG